MLFPGLCYWINFVTRTTSGESMWKHVNHCKKWSPSKTGEVCPPDPMLHKPLTPCQKICPWLQCLQNALEMWNEDSVLLSPKPLSFQTWMASLLAPKCRGAVPRIPEWDVQVKKPLSCAGLVARPLKWFHSSLSWVILSTKRNWYPHHLKFRSWSYSASEVQRKNCQCDPWWFGPILINASYWCEVRLEKWFAKQSMAIDGSEMKLLNDCSSGRIPRDRGASWRSTGQRRPQVEGGFAWMVG